MSHYSYATSAYGYALDQVEECLRTGREPFITNQNLAQMRMYRRELINVNITKNGLVAAFLGALFIAGGLQMLLGDTLAILAGGGLAGLILAKYIFDQSIDGLISRIGGGKKVQQKESAKILNALIKKSL